MKKQEMAKKSFWTLCKEKVKASKAVKSLALAGAVIGGGVSDSPAFAAGVPTVSLTYDLADVAGSIGSWFSSLWLILAFAVAIPLAFLILRNLKELFTN